MEFWPRPSRACSPSPGHSRPTSLQPAHSPRTKPRIGHQVSYRPLKPNIYQRCGSSQCRTWTFRMLKCWRSPAWPAGARRLGLLLPILALVTLASVPVATHAGEWLEQHVGSDPLVRKHAEPGDGLLPWALGLFVFSAVVWWTTRRSAPAGLARRGPPGRPRHWFGAWSWLFPSLSRSAPWWTSTGSATRAPRQPGRTTTPRRPHRTAADGTGPTWHVTPACLFASCGTAASPLTGWRPTAGQRSGPSFRARAWRMARCRRPRRDGWSVSSVGHTDCVSPLRPSA